MKEKRQIKGKKLRIVFWTLVILWMAFIFYMSAQNGEESAQMSTPIARLVAEIVIPGFEDKTVSEQAEIENIVSFIIRKSAHFTEYAILGFLVHLVVQMYISKNIAVLLTSWGVSTLYAASDEFHQSFVGGRGPQVKDVCIDSAGAFVGVLLSVVFLLILIRRANKKKHSKHIGKGESKL